MNEETENVKALLVEMFYDKRVGDETKRVKSAVIYHPGEFPKEIIDYGNYWDHTDCGSVYLVDKNGTEITSEWSRVCDRIHDDADISGRVANELRGGVKRPGEWVESAFFNDCGKSVTIRITALSGHPEIDAGTIEDENPDLDETALRIIRVNGKPLMDPDKVLNGKNIDRRNASAIVDDAIAEYIRARSGKNVSVKASIYLESDDVTPGFSMSVSGDSEDEVRTALGAAFGIPNANDIRIARTEGTVEGGVKRVVAHLCVRERNW